MSLLLDALRRAEEARRAKEAENDVAQSANNVTAASSERVQYPAPPPQPSPSRDLAFDDAAPITPPVKSRASDGNNMAPFTAYHSGLALEELPNPDVVLAPEPAVTPEALQSRATLESPQENSQRDMARNVFAAKFPRLQLMGAEGKRKWMLPIVAGIFVILGAGGWYVWNEINRVSRPAVARISSPPIPLPPAAPGTGQIGGRTATTEALAAKADEAPLPPPVPPLLPPPAVEAPMAKSPAPSATERALTERESRAKKLKDAPVAKESAVGLKLAQTIAPPKLNAELPIAYQTLVSGDYALAQKQYSKLVQAEPLNIDAQLGLATAFARGGDAVSANRHYRQVLALDPRNGLAIMGLVALSESAQPASLEIELKTLIGRNPEAAPLHFALGNLYASGRRWTEAQQAYFEAFRIDALNPDYLFNLAVSLDHLRQSRLALNYYRQAEAIALAKGGGQFDRKTIAKRIAELGGETASN